MLNETQMRRANGKHRRGSTKRDKNEKTKRKAKTKEKEKLNMGKMNEVFLAQDLSSSFMEGRGTSSFPSDSFPSLNFI
jgi:hypothetical protein